MAPRPGGPPPPAGPPPCRSGRRARPAVGAAPRRRLRLEQRQDTGHRRRLPGARPAGDHREPPQDGGGRRHALVRIVPSNKLRQAAPQQIRRRPPGAAPSERSRRSAATRLSSAHRRSRYKVVPSRCSGRSSPTIGLRRHLPDPRRRRRARAARRGRPACRCRRRPWRGWWPGRRRRGPAAAPAPRGPPPEQTTSSSVPLSRASRSATWTSDVDEDARLVEGAQRPSGAERQPGVEPSTALELAQPARPRSKRSLSASTRRPAVATTTPRGGRAVAGAGSAALMPRTNR